MRWPRDLCIGVARFADIVTFLNVAFAPVIQEFLTAVRITKLKPAEGERRAGPSRPFLRRRGTPPPPPEA